LTHLDGKKGLAEELAYDMSLPPPAPLSREHDQDFFVGLASYPTPTLVSPVRKVVFNLRCKDQGTTSSNLENRGTFHGAWTWFEAGLERFDAAKACKRLIAIPAKLNFIKSVPY
jgi:hypothetical protein